MYYLWSIVEPKGLVLGPLLIITYINDLDCGMTSDTKEFADETKLERAIRSDSSLVLHEELNFRHEQSNKWMVQFNTNKCNILAERKSGSLRNYTLCDSSRQLKLQERFGCA